ncbi:hypothetical protein [Pseudoleptotrichia goodfellowii]|uniref:Porin n=1 Tax=Pseudoleptotrichia goodfellowii TaxID=157692 RepID=A0A510J962_9FUSO|nr:hypothetical protein [Pseudoleptotrichia goodfellowii]BBM35727.1 hypothetical protein JCM16774_0657 [Pseudoleptotrichia goodfellowii]
MKKIVSLLALTLAISGVAYSEQDVIKSIKVTSEVRQGWQDKDGDKANGIGNAGFKKNNRARTRWRNAVSGNINLVDEWGLEASFLIRNDQDTNRNKFDSSSRNITNLGIYNKREGWYTNLELSKSLKLGALDTNTIFGWTHEASRQRIDPLTGKESLTGQKQTKGILNEIYFGPKFDVKLFGQNISTTVQGVYFNIKGNKSGDYHWSGSDFVNGRADGWGLNLDLSTSGNIFEGGFGKVGYNVDLTHHFRDAKGKVAATGEDAKSNVYIDYYTAVHYTTPSFAGFYGKITVDNEWEKYTAVNGWNNYFSIWTDLGYKASFDTSVGTISVNPFVRYRPLHRETAKDHSGRKTIEINEVRAGLSIGLTAK